VKNKKCCLDIKVKKEKVTFSRNDFISAPYKNCPHCKNTESFGVFVPISGSNHYTRECIVCHHEERIELPDLQKKVVYLDQFVISNLIKLLDSSHPSHERIKRDPFWHDLFVALEKAAKSQAIVCPDSSFHKDESSVGGIDFNKAKNLYEHFSGGKTLFPAHVIEERQVLKHFADWLDGKKSIFTFDPQDISFGDLHTWEIGMRVSVGFSQKAEEINHLKQINASTEQQLAEIWKKWQSEKMSFEDKAKEEVLGFGKGVLVVTKSFIQKRAVATLRALTDPSFQFDLNDILPPPAFDLMEHLMRIAAQKGVDHARIPNIISEYLLNADSLLQIPYFKINSIMLAGLARSAYLGEKMAPKSTADVQFISSYLPYCDAMFVDKQSARILRELPKDTPKHLRIDEYGAKIFSLNERNNFLKYLDDLVTELPKEHIEILKDINGDTYDQPYWSILEDK